MSLSKVEVILWWFCVTWLWTERPVMQCEAFSEVKRLRTRGAFSGFVAWRVKILVKSTVPAGTMEVSAHIQITTDWEKEAALPHLNTPLLHYRHRNIPGGKTLQIGMNESQYVEKCIFSEKWTDKLQYRCRYNKELLNGSIL